MISFFSKKITPPVVQHHYQKSIEQYRGLCALLVLLAHVTASDDFLTDHFKWQGFIRYIGAGYLSVMVFFCISGYVIAITNDQYQLNIKSYFKKRLLRLYPIYIIAILLCLIVTSKINLLFLLANFFFMQNSNSYLQLHIPVFVNYVTWSLNYEILYYTLFIPLFFIKPKVWHLLLIMLLLSFALINCNNQFLFLSNYINGFYFWILGLLFGWKIISGKEKESTYIPILSMLFLQLCQHHLGVGAIILHTVHINTNTNLNWIFDIPFCMMIVGILTNTSNLFLRINKVLCYIIPACVFVYLTLNSRLFENERWIMCLIYWILSLIFYQEKKFSGLILRQLTAVGKISYSLYLVHVPVALLIKKTIFINNQTLEIIIKHVLWIVVTFSLSFVLDQIYQPAIKKYLDKKLLAY